MIISIRENPLAPPAYESAGATNMEIRDPEGHLVMLARMLDDNTVLVSTKADEDFEWNAAQARTPLYQDPSTIRTGPQGAIQMG